MGHTLGHTQNCYLGYKLNTVWQRMTSDVLIGVVISTFRYLSIYRFIHSFYLSIPTYTSLWVPFVVAAV